MWYMKVCREVEAGKLDRVLTFNSIFDTRRPATSCSSKVASTTKPSDLAQQTKMSYYNLSSILSTSHTLPSTLAFDIPHLGVLDSRPGETLNANSQVSLPIYLAAFLAIQRIGDNAPLALDLPESLSPKVLNALKADPRTVELRQLAPHFYESAERVLELFEEDELTGVLTNTFKLRAAEIADMAQNVRKASNADNFMRGLDERERELFRAAHDSAKAVRNWMGEKKS